MTAYNIGQTQFNVTQMKGLAEYITSQLQEYSRQEKNCQLFALSLGTRVLMTKGAGTIFVGTKAQIANWDLTATIGEQSSPYSQEEGFLLRAPSSGRSTCPDAQLSTQKLTQIPVSRFFTPFGSSLSRPPRSLG
jgi:hypothetical protein